MKGAHIHPAHSSILGRGTAPYRMTKVLLSDSQREFIESQALSIFADCTNAGKSFNEALAAVLMSGIDWGKNHEKQKNNPFSKG